MYKIRFEQISPYKNKQKTRFDAEVDTSQQFILVMRQ